MTARSTSGDLVDRVIALSRALQGRGFPISLAETVDAAEAVQAIDLGDRAELRSALRSTLVKRNDARNDFDTLFDRHFPTRLAERPIGYGRDVDAPLDVMGELVGDGDLPELAGRLVDRFGGIDADSANRSERHHVLRVVRAADLARMMGLAMRAEHDLTPDEIRSRIEALQQLIGDEVRDRLGHDELADPSVEDVEFLNASRADLERMRETIRPLARQVAARLARRRRRQRSGRVDMRSTMRRSLSTGGVPFDVRRHRRSPHQPELWVLCDISGSVAEFSLFTLTLMSALSAELARTRSFVFVDEVDEVTELLARTAHGIEPWQLMRNTNVIGATGHSDYGAVLERFWERWGERELRPTSTVVLTGDGRCNDRPARAEVLAEISRRVRAVYWLDPEPRREWDRADSEMARYEPHCTSVFEVRDLRQLAHCVERLL